MSNTVKNEKTSTSKSIASLALPERQRNRALADLALADNVVSALIAARKLLHLR